MQKGTYYNRITKEITTITSGDLPSETGWTLLTDETRLGLLAARAMLVDRRLVDDESAVYWHFPQPLEANEPLFLCQEPSERKAA